MIRIDGLSWDDRAEDHIAKHGVKFEEVEQAVMNYLDARKGRSGYLLVIGQTESGRYLLVVLDDEGEGIWYPVTARPASQSERRMARLQTTARRT